MFNHLIILAAGRSVRMWPLTEYVPKAMALADGKTLIETSISKYKSVGLQIHVTVGYKAEVLANHILPQGVDTLVNTSGRGNSWWIYHSLLGHIDEPVVVLTCDSLMDVDLDKLWESYTKAGRPACMLLPTKVRDGFDGDYIEKRDDGQIVRLDRANRTDIIGSGCQVLNPHQVASLTSSSDDFLEVWAKLMEQGQLYSADFTVQNWFTFDTVEQLKSYRALKDI